MLFPMDHQIFIGFGTNLGDREANLAAARKSLAPQIKIVAASSVYETAPWGYLDQPNFLNQVIECITDLLPLDLLRNLKDIETSIGRRPTFRYGPRLIDIDILLYDDLLYDSPGLQIPHPSLHERAFVLVPLCDLAPDLIHPLLQETMSALLDAIDTSGVLLYESNASV
jgi:2-amino-4-hydroxy-6-hydroxymethyldihydropteridine diphosphokinase